MPISLLGMLLLTTARQRFTCVSRILQPQLPTAVRLAVATAPCSLVARLSGGGYSVPSASDPGVTPNARLGRVPVAEHRIYILDKYACDLVSHWRAKRRPIVPGRRRRVRAAAVAKGPSVPVASGGGMQSASDTPSSHIWSAPHCKGKIAVYMKDKLQSYIRHLV
jgi:hypothetical protein